MDQAGWSLQLGLPFTSACLIVNLTAAQQPIVMHVDLNAKTANGWLAIRAAQQNLECLPAQGLLTLRPA